MFTEAPVVLSGTFIYGGTVECDVRIVHSPVRFGSGDQDDHADIRDDVETPTFYVEYGSTTQRGVFTAGGGGHSSLAAAVTAAEVALGGASAVKWLPNPQFQPTPNGAAERNR
jgi:hypothetical protein